MKNFVFVACIYNFLMTVHAVYLTYKFKGAENTFSQAVFFCQKLQHFLLINMIHFCIFTFVHAFLAGLKWVELRKRMMSFTSWHQSQFSNI